MCLHLRLRRCLCRSTHRGVLIPCFSEVDLTDECIARCFVHPYLQWLYRGDYFERVDWRNGIFELHLRDLRVTCRRNLHREICNVHMLILAKS